MNDAFLTPRPSNLSNAPRTIRVGEETSKWRSCLAPPMTRWLALVACILAAGCAAPIETASPPIPVQATLSWQNTGSVPIFVHLEASPGWDTPFEEGDAFLQPGERIEWRGMLQPGHIALRASYHHGGPDMFSYSQQAVCHGPLQVKAQGGYTGGNMGGLDVPLVGQEIGLSHAC